MSSRAFAFVLVALGIWLVPPSGRGGEIKLARDDASHTLTVSIEGRRRVEYHYSPDHFLPYFHPVLSPSGKELTVRLTKPYPHHRSLWIADNVQFNGHPAVNFYAAYYKPKTGAAHRIRHDKFLTAKVDGGVARLEMQLIWELESKTPVLTERREMAIKPLGGGEYLIDLRFALTADYGDVRFVSDWIHYAWPYLRMHRQFSVQKGGRIVNSEGGINQRATNAKAATWVDYSNTVDGVTEGLAIFSHPANEHPHKWLTRDYGCFGPRRADAKSGTRFVVKKGGSLEMRVGILVHKGDVRGGKVAERYRDYAKGESSLLPASDK